MTACLLCEQVGPAASLQDEGRPGLAQQGLAASGAMDPRCLYAANLLLGNAPGEAALELGPGGITFAVEADAVRLVYAGPRARLLVDGRAVAAWRSHLLRRGQRLRIDGPRDGMWGCLAIAGGFDAPPVLGSRSTHGRARIGGFAGRPIRPGDRLPLLLARPPDRPDHAMSPPVLDHGGPIALLLGPQAEFFARETLELFARSTYHVSMAADRMAYRLDGHVLTHARDFNIVSDAVLPGSVQVPGNGRPIVMLKDHQTTGGYPKLGTVVAADLPVLAQRPPGAALQFRFVELAAADDLRRRERDRWKALLATVGPATEGTGSTASEDLLALNLVDGVVDGRAPCP